ncbi:unnamed protein product [Caenorhabditis sp. 36 PRJEB53466]|nr:unnamed protein product [Caenorhabditis sp. 36 PRJEB53466]
MDDYEYGDVYSNAGFRSNDVDIEEMPKVKPMDIVVVLALVVLAFVFILSLLILVITCQKRRHKRPKHKILVPFETPPVRFTRPVNDEVEEIDSMEQLNDMLGELLDKNPWLFEARGIMQHIVATLTICRSITMKMAGVQMPCSPSPFHDAVNMAIRNIYPRFDDLIESIAAQPVDLRLLEARALSLGTVCWSLYLPFTLMDERHKEELTKPLNEMNLHLVTIRTAAHLVTISEKGVDQKIDLVDLKDQLMRMRRKVRGELMIDDEYETEDDLDDDVSDDDDAHNHLEEDGVLVKKGGPTNEHHEKTPLVQSEATVDMIEMTRFPLIDPEKLMMSNGTGTPEKLVHSSSPVHLHHHHHHPHHMTNGSLNTVEESNEDDHHGEGTSTSCSSSSTSSSAASSTNPIDHHPKA